MHVISFLFLNANDKVLAFCVTFPNLIFVFLCVVLSFHHAAHTASSIFRESSLPGYSLIEFTQFQRQLRYTRLQLMIA